VGPFFPDTVYIVTVSILRSIVMSVSICLFVCWSVCLSVHSRISETTRPNFTKFSARAVAQSSDDNGIRYVFPVLWMTSCMGPMACGIGNVYASAVLAARSDKFPTYSPGCATLFDFVVLCNVSKFRTCCVIDDTRGALPLVDGLQRAV